MNGITIGVDCGGTGARAVVLARSGAVVGRADGPGALASVVDPTAAVRAVVAVVREAAALAEAPLPADVLWAGIAGAGREASRTAVEFSLGRTGLARVVRVGTDVEAAFHDAFGDGPGVLLVAGTGSIAWGRAHDGREERAGGFGHRFGDEGSAYAIGVEALRRAAWAVDGRGRGTVLADRLLARLRLASVNEAVTWVATATKRDVAALAPLVVAAAAEGDDVAARILAGAVEDLEKHVHAVVAKLGPWPEPPGLALSGALIQPGGALRDALTRALESAEVSLLDRAVDPAMGAARLGARGV